MTLQERIALLQAIEKNPNVPLQYKASNGEWANLLAGTSAAGTLNFASYDYRIKPEPRVTYAIYRDDDSLYRCYTSKDMAEKVAADLRKCNMREYTVVEMIEKMIY